MGGFYLFPRDPNWKWKHTAIYFGVSLALGIVLLVFAFSG